MLYKKFLSFSFISVTLLSHYNINFKCVAKDEYQTFLSSTKNTRDLGGYPAEDGKVTRFNRIYRSDNCDNLSYEDVEKLKKVNLTLDMDFRNSHEIERSPDDIIKKLPEVTYVNIPFFDFDGVKDYIHSVIKGYISWHQFYIKALSSDSQKKKIKKIFDSIASCESGSILIHCTHGKDRTGIISALILALCGVSKEDIINNFSVSQELLNPKESDFSKLPNAASSNKSIMNDFMEFLEKFGGCEIFLMSCGIKKTTLNKVRAFLLDDRNDNTSGGNKNI